MKQLAIIFNIASLATVIFLLATKGVPNDDEYWIIIILAGGSIFALLHIFINGSGNNSSFIGLWIQRKKLEEQQKIDRLKTK